MAHANGIEGQKYGRLTVIGRYGSKKGNKQSRALWLCVCDCGGRKIASTRDLTCGKTKSCGCLADESRRLGLGRKYDDNETIKKHNALRAIWKGLIRRCYCETFKEYHCYGGRGISVCDEWRDKSNEFIKWGLENGYELGLSIDRIDNDGDYSPSNCAFISRSENSKKKSSSHYLSANGMKKTLCEWSNYLNRNPGYLGYWQRKYGCEKAEQILLENLKNKQNAQ